MELVLALFCASGLKLRMKRNPRVSPNSQVYFETAYFAVQMTMASCYCTLCHFPKVAVLSGRRKSMQVYFEHKSCNSSISHSRKSCMMPTFWYIGGLWFSTVNYVAVHVAGKITSLHTDDNHDLLVLATSQGSIILITLRTLPFSKDLPERPPSPRGFLPVDELSLVDVLLVDDEDREEGEKNSEVSRSIYGLILQ